MTDPRFEELEQGIFRLCIPFEELYTSVFALNEGDKWVLCDTATNGFDVDNYILPALRALGASPDSVLLSHSHEDHAGGLPFLRNIFPNAKIISCPTALTERFEAISLKGHSVDSLAVFDITTKTLLSFDCLQQNGIGRFRNGVSDPSSYLQSISKVRELAPRRIIFSHDYDPCGWNVAGAQAVQKVLEVCEESIGQISRG